MKLHVLSDIHLEFEDFDPPSTDADVVILAGDIHVGTKAIPWAQKRFAGRPVLYVVGNHEFYRHKVPGLVGKLEDLAKGSNVHVLDRRRLELDGVVFLGCTLWTDFELFGNPRIAGYEAARRMNDYRVIRIQPEYRKLTPLDTSLLHGKARRWLSQEFEALEYRPAVVVTHHAPSSRSLPEAYRQELLSAAFASPLDDLVDHSGAALWIHGHLHSSSDYRIGRTRVVCNPRGYPQERNPDFDPGLVIDLPR